MNARHHCGIATWIDVVLLHGVAPTYCEERSAGAKVGHTNDTINGWHWHSNDVLGPHIMGECLPGRLVVSKPAEGADRG